MFFRDASNIFAKSYTEPEEMEERFIVWWV